MATKQLTATVRLNTNQAEQKLKSIAKAIDRLNQAAGKQSSSYNQVNNALKRTTQNTTKARTETDRWASSANKVNTNFRRTGSLIGTISGKLRGLVNTYLGVMGVKGMIGASDTLTSAENKLNYISAQQLGKAGTNADGTYSARTMYATQDAMNKMYNSSQKVRMSYADMMTNVSKSMALAGESFGNSTDNAIRFQEIMAEAYAIGGASAAEMSSSMYQLIQALGSGTLAGDELRSVREGAPLAYKAIEEFAQGVYNTEESLKELGSQGKITSDMVVAAIMNAGKEMDTAFAQTEQTFAQTWSQIKNAALKSFRPVADMLRNALNKAIDNGLIEKFEVAFNTIAKIVMIVGTIIANVVSWIADNWDWLQHLVVAGLLVLAGMWIWNAGVAIMSIIATILALNSLQWTLILILVGLLSLVYIFYLWKTAAIDTCQAIASALLVVGAIILIIGLIWNSTWLIAIGIALLVVAVILSCFEQVCGGAMWLGAIIVDVILAIWNVIVFCVNFILAVLAAIMAVIINVVAGIINLVMGLWNTVCAVAQNIGIAFSNAWHGALSSFWNFIAECLEGLEWLAKPLEAIAKLFGKSFDYNSFVGGVRGKASTHAGKQQEYVSVGDAWSSGWNTMDYANVSGAFNAGMNAVEYADLIDPFDAYQTGAKWGAGVKDSINEWGSQYQTGFDFDLDTIGNKLGLDFGTLNDDNYSNKLNALSDIMGNEQAAKDLLNDNPEEAAKLLGGKGGKSPKDILNGVNGINDNTSKIADSMDLTEEDLKYLRDVANMEWKKEFTTANIVVDMNNYNNISKEVDFDSVVIGVRDVVEEEMYALADGVYEG